MKIFNTMNTLFAAIAMTVGISMGTSAHAGLVYSGSYEVTLSDVSENFGYFDFNVISAQDDTEFYDMASYYFGYAELYANQNYFEFSSATASLDTVILVESYMEVTFDTATEVSVSYWSDMGLSTDLPQGTYMYDAGETMSFYLNVDQSLNIGNISFVIAFTEVPAPGALALLGLAGITTRRRRR